MILKLNKNYKYKRWTWHAEKVDEYPAATAEIFVGGKYVGDIEIEDLNKKNVERLLEGKLEAMRDIADVFQIKIEEF